MRLSTSSSNLSFMVFFATIFLGFAGLEFYARKVVSTESETASIIANIIRGRGDGGVFGDSHVGSYSYLPGYTFYGSTGQQPEEFERIVRYLVSRKRIKNAIVMASPQWFGEYHIGREEMIAAGSLPPAYLTVDMFFLSKVFRERFADSLAGHSRSAIGAIIREMDIKRAAAIERPSSADVGRIAAEWSAAVEAVGGSGTFRWSSFPAEKRATLTTNRVFEQNPRRKFQESNSALAFRRAIALLSQAGVSICFYRTPVTGGYEETSKVIPNSRYDEYADYIRELAQEYKSALVGYKELSYDFGDSRFMNQDHLNTSSLRDVWPMVERACKKMTESIGQSGSRISARRSEGRRSTDATVRLLLANWEQPE